VALTSLVMEQRKLTNKFSQLRLPRVQPGQACPANTDRLHRFRGHNMDQLVQDFNTALDETAGSNSSCVSTTSRKKAWKRRCKSTSNLLAGGQNMSDSSSTVDTVGMLSRDIDRGTSSLQFSDSDIEVGPGMESELVMSGKNWQSRMQEYRSKRGGADHLGIESDSFTENISPFKDLRGVHTRRKRKLKRIDVDCVVSAQHTVASKRKKVRSRSGADTRTQGSVMPGKRKRSAREKSEESGEIFCSGRSRTAILGSMERMEMEEVGSSSSISSSEWEGVHSDGGPEADDEQSDWPGPEPGISVMQLTDEETDPAITFPQVVTGPGRVTRSGSRRLRGQTGGLHAYGEQVSRFMQDNISQTLHLPAIKATDRSMILSLASLYSLSWIPEGSHMLVLSKTSQSVEPEFAVPGVPSTRAKDTKRQRRTPPVQSSKHSSGSKSN